MEHQPPQSKSEKHKSKKKGKLLGRCPKTRKGQRQNPQKQKVVSAWGATPSGV
jgi:hypothetical protein